MASIKHRDPSMDPRTHRKSWRLKSKPSIGEEEAGTKETLEITDKGSLDNQ